jgi:squalene-hopene/tetraprenyl-beta-curcumene cyclase
MSNKGIRRVAVSILALAEAYLIGVTPVRAQSAPTSPPATARTTPAATQPTTSTPRPTTQASQPATQATTRPAMPPLAPAVAAEADRAAARGLEYLASTQGEDGGWTAQYGPAVTAIVAQAFVQDRRYGPKHPVVRRAKAHILRFEQADGGIYERQQNLANYQTSVVLMLLSRLDDPELRPRIAKAQAFLKGLQYDEAESVDIGNPWYGGAGYNESKRPDLSNTQMMLEALHDSGLPATDPVYQRALKFVTRCQMYDPTNDQKFADGAMDGGFIYSPNAEGESKANDERNEGNVPLRSYGSMTYSGFKSMLYANVGRDDARIRACREWIRRNWTLEQNPGMPERRSHEGLYYYYHVFARAMAAWGEPVVVDAGGGRHDWREELCRKLASLQKADGSWVNEQDRWLEGDANYVTALAVLSLQTAEAEGSSADFAD